MVSIKRYIRSGLKKVLPGKLPDFLIIGAQKSGTTSLYSYLNQHSKIIGSNPKEIRFFDRDERYKKGIEWYKQAFVFPIIPKHGCKYFEATPDYLYRPHAAKRIFDFNPRMKLVMVFRNPVKRAYSSWNMYRDFLINRRNLPGVLERGYLEGHANNLYRELYEPKVFPSFHEVIINDIHKFETNSDLLEPSFVRRGIYHKQISNYEAFFSREQMLIIGFNDLIGSNKIETLNKILAFIDLKECNWQFLHDEKRNARVYPERISDKDEALLEEFYKPHNEKLFDMLGFKLNW